MSAQLLAGEPQSPASPPETGASPERRVSRVKLAGACGLVGVVLFVAYIRLSWTAPVNSDGAANVLQAYDMLHGNVLLHGWWLSDVSFYSTELPQYVVLEALLGAVPAVIHVAAAMTYTIVIVLAAVLAKGRSTWTWSPRSWSSPWPCCSPWECSGPGRSIHKVAARSPYCCR